MNNDNDGQSKKLTISQDSQPKQSKLAKKLGRPILEFNPEVATLICLELAEGKSLRAIMREYDEVPSFYSIYKWLEENEEFSEQYKKARKHQADSYLDKMLMIAEDTKADLIEANGTVKVNNRAVNRARLEIDTLKWVMGKLNGTKYGDKVTTVHEGQQNAVNVLVDSGPSETREEWEIRQRKKIEARRKQLEEDQALKAKSLVTENTNTREVKEDE